MGIFAILSVMCSYCCKKFRWSNILYILWIFFVILGILIFVLSGFLLIISFSAFDSCSAYNYYLSSQANFNTLPAATSNSQTGKILSQCFFNGGTTIFTAFSGSSAAVQNF
jgi:hypothetical protein